MANVLDDILKGVGEFSRRYQYGPYYEEDRQSQMKLNEARLESERARRAHFERMDGLELKDLIKTYDTLNEWKYDYEPSKKDSPEIARQKADSLAEINTILQQVKSVISQRVSRNNITKTSMPMQMPTPSKELLSIADQWLAPTSLEDTSAPINQKAEVQPTAKPTATQPRGIAQRIKQGLVMPALGSQRLAGFSQGPFGTTARNMTEALQQKNKGGALSNIKTPAIATTMYGLDTTALGVPPLQISTPEELDRLPSGSFFIAPDGTLRRKK